MDTSEREPLGDLESIKNVAKVRPMSRLPTPAKGIKSGLRAPKAALTPQPPPELDLASDTQSTKRKSDEGTMPAKKRARLNTSTVSDPGTEPTRPAPSRRPLASRSARPATTRPKPIPPPSRSTTTTSRVAASRTAKPPVAPPPATTASTGPPKPKKRPTWDLKGRLQDMEEERRSQLKVNEELRRDMTRHMELLESIAGQHKDLPGSDLETRLSSLSRNVTNFEEENHSLKRQKTALQGELDALITERSGLLSSLASLRASQAGIVAELATAKATIESLSTAKSALEKQVASYITQLEELTQKERSWETERRHLHNTVMELKGNIRVFCRVRPRIGSEKVAGEGGELQHFKFPDKTTDKKLLLFGRASDPSEKPSEFSFDRTFGPNDSQSEVFGEISQLVQSAVDGYSVCIFAYGQTGSGKTYTMEGPPGAPSGETLGMIPRAVQQIFSTARSLQDKGWEYKFTASFLEIYNETIRDLLGNGADDIKHEIKLVAADSKELYVTNLTTIEVTDADQVSGLLRRAGENRAVAETRCNTRSSRSHSVFQMRIVGHNNTTGEDSDGILNLIDLAGSERLKESGSAGDRLKETQAINTSLSKLGNVIMALGNKDGHIPFRNSKLTYLLQNHLGGQSKVLMFVNVSPRDDFSSETLNSLRFATKVNNCNIGTARKHLK